MFSLITPPLLASKAHTLGASELDSRARRCGLPDGYRIDHVEIIPEHQGGDWVRLDVNVVGDDSVEIEPDILGVRRDAERAIIEALELE